MGLFEQNPWLLIPVVILINEGWNAVKAVLKDAIRRRNSTTAP